MAQAIFVHEGASIDHTPGGNVAAGDVVLRGDNMVGIAKLDILAGRLGALCVMGVYDVVKDDSDVVDGDPLYWDADGDPVGGTAGSGAFSKDPTKGPFAGWALAAAGVGVGAVRMSLTSRDSAVAVQRAALVQDDLQSYPILVDKLRVWDAPKTNLTDAGNDDLGVVYYTFLTAPPSVETGDVKATETARKLGFQFALPPEYVAAQTITLRINAGMKTTVADVAATVDAQAARQADPTADLVATAAQSINDLTAADKDFTITPTNCVPGDILDVVVTVDIDDDATGTAVIAKINKIELLLDIKG